MQAAGVVGGPTTTGVVGGPTTTGVVGGRWRATVTAWGAVEPWDGAAVTDWYVAADDRWHLPSEEASTRQLLVEGTAVVETRVRIPGGDAVQRVYSVADAGGLTVIEVTNESTLPIAVAFTGGGLLSSRPPTAMPPQGIDLPADAVIFPVGHQATVVVARSHGPATELPDSLPSAAQVVRGWLAQTKRASRLHLPDVAMVDAVTAARCRLLLDGPTAGILGVDDPLAVVLGIAELVRMGEQPGVWVEDLAEQLEQLGRLRTPLPAEVVAAAGRVLHAAGERRALADLQRIAPGEPLGGPMPDAAGGIPAWVEAQLVQSDQHVARLLPNGVPQPWLGVGFEAHGLPIGVDSTVSYAIRWHGERPAVLWEVAGPPLPLTAGQWAGGSWASSEATGEALLPAVAVHSPSFS